MLLEGMMGELTEVQRTILSKAYDSNERQLKIVSDLLKVARVDAGKVVLRKSETDVNVLMAEIVAEEKEIAKQRQQKIVFIPSKKPAVALVDRDTIRMVFENLIDNASKYSQEDTTITVEIIVHETAIEAKISDEGVGISEEDYNKLFEKFSRIHNPLSTQAGGSGLGLYWAKKVVDLHNGTIIVASREDEGTEFSIKLPRVIHKVDMVK
jgi:signal transduction histidine kinase